MLNKEMSLQEIINLIKDIQYLDFANATSISYIYFLNELLQNPNNKQYTKSIEFLYNFSSFKPDSFKQKYRCNGIKEEIIETFYDILNKLPSGSFKAKIASIILIEHKTIKIDKPKLAKIIIENFTYDFDKIFQQDWIDENNIYFTLDLAYKFNVLNIFQQTLTKLKNIFDAYINNNIKSLDFKFIRLYKNCAHKKWDIWDKTECISMVKLLYRSSTNRTENLFINKSSNHIEKDIICEILQLIVFMLDKIEKDKYKHIKIRLQQKIIDINLKFAQQNNNSEIAFPSLICARDIAEKQNNTKLAKEINKIIQNLNKKILKKMQTVEIPFDDKQRKIIKEYDNMIKILLKGNLNLFEVFIRSYIVEINFEHLQSRDSALRYIMTTLEFDKDDLISAIRHEKDDIFMDYYHCVRWHSIFCNIIKTNLLRKFYPQKEYFYPIIYDNNIIPKGYEEVIVRMLYVGIHNDSIDFFIYLSTSIESILRNILDKCGIVSIRTNKKDKTQEYDTLETMIQDIKVYNLLDANLIKEFELIFSKKGFNLRNKIAHSRFDTNSFIAYSWLCDYLWCFMMNFFIKYRNKCLCNNDSESSIRFPRNPS